MRARITSDAEGHMMEKNTLVKISKCLKVTGNITHKFQVINCPETNKRSAQASPSLLSPCGNDNWTVTAKTK
jgi:hypothetical protein